MSSKGPAQTAVEAILEEIALHAETHPDWPEISR